MTALAAGKHTLHLGLFAEIVVSGALAPLQVTAFDMDINVKVRVSSWLSDFIAKNWQWLWAAIGLPVAGWLWHRWSRSAARSDRPATPKS